MNPPEGPAPADAGGSRSGGGRDPGEPLPPATLFLFGVPIHNVTTGDALAWIAARARSGRPAQVVTSNLDFIMQALRDPEMQRIHLEADLVVADGWPPVFFSGWFGPRLKGRVAGSDMVAMMGGFARDKNLSLYALGGKEGVAVEALRILGERSPGLRVAGCFSPPVAGLGEMDHAGLRARIAEAKPDVLLVAFGAPKQDKWIRMNGRRIGRGVALGIGASLDFIVGVQTRAPRWIQSLGMEWFWRLCSQPRRLFKRYAANLIFLPTMLARLLLIRAWPGGGKPCAPAPDRALTQSRAAEVVPLRPLRTEKDAEEFCRPLEVAAPGRILVLDLSGYAWLNSLELGAVARLARASWSRGGRLFLLGVTVRARRLLRLVKLDRWVEQPESPEEWSRRLDEFAGPEERRRTICKRDHDALEVVLAEEFDSDEAARVETEYARLAAVEGLRRVVIDGHRLQYLDSSGLLFLRNVWRSAQGREGFEVRLRSFPRRILDQLEREGLSVLAASPP